jgi:cytochrome c-type biogenesis protein CcmF
LWIVGGIIAVGTAMAAFPGRRRQPTDPVSAPTVDARSDGDGDGDGQPSTELAGVG